METRLVCLLDRARAMCKTDAELAERLGVPSTHPAQWRNGSKRMTAQTVGLLADFVGIPPDDARRMALQAVVEGVRDPAKQSRLRKLLLGFTNALRRRSSDLDDTRPGVGH